MREVRRGADRFRTDGDRVSTRHSFSYGQHYDPENVRFGSLIAINEERVEPGAGYDPHRHADVEIVTWVLEGTLRHVDTTGHRGDIAPDTAQRLSAGTGVDHAERNASADAPLVFIQMMLVSDHWEAPDYDQARVPDETGVLHPTVLVRAQAELRVARLEPGQAVTVPASPRSLVHVTRGEVLLDDTVLARGDEARLTDAGAYDLSAAPDAPGGAEVLVWLLQR
jgi:redox-sensitive bicupin YhaK (pirin superfamily)